MKEAVMARVVDGGRAKSAQPNVAPLVVSASERKASPPSRARVERIGERTRRDPVWRKTD
jgi:hypothetical protein